MHYSTEVIDMPNVHLTETDAKILQKGDSKITLTLLLGKMQDLCEDDYERRDCIGRILSILNQVEQKDNEDSYLCGLLLRTCFQCDVKHYKDKNGNEHHELVPEPFSVLELLNKSFSTDTEELKKQINNCFGRAEKKKLAFENHLFAGEVFDGIKEILDNVVKNRQNKEEKSEHKEKKGSTTILGSMYMSSYEETTRANASGERAKRELIDHLKKMKPDNLEMAVSTRENNQTLIDAVKQVVIHYEPNDPAEREKVFCTINNYVNDIMQRKQSPTGEEFVDNILRAVKKENGKCPSEWSQLESLLKALNRKQTPDSKESGDVLKNDIGTPHP